MIGECESCEVKTQREFVRECGDYAYCTEHSPRFEVPEDLNSLARCPAGDNHNGRSDSYGYRCSCGAVNQCDDLGNHVCDECGEDFHICAALDFGLTKDDEPCTEYGCAWFS